MFIKSNTQNRYNVFDMIKAFEDLVKNKSQSVENLGKIESQRVKYNCKIISLSDDGQLK